MFFEKLTRLFHRRPKYITVAAPAAGLLSSSQTQPPARMPRHVAIIMDGNGRWARQRGLSRSAGHAAGTEALRDIIRASDDWGIEALSLYAFSTENWARSKEEVAALMGLLLKYFNSEIDELDEKNVRIIILGDVEGLPEEQRDAVCAAMDRTRNNTGLKLNIALNYGGRAELTRAARLLADQVSAGTLDPEEITEDLFARQLYTADSPDVDLLIRTSGEMRTSNFLPWQLVYAEMVFTNVYWPDFTRDEYLKCLHIYAERDRRFGGVKDEAADDEPAAATPESEQTPEPGAEPEQAAEPAPEPEPEAASEPMAEPESEPDAEAPSEPLEEDEEETLC